MDELIRQGQWWWLLLPLGTGVFALVGSWLGAKLGKNNEHQQWLRNQKIDKYTAYVNACKHIVATAHGTSPDKETFNESWATMRLIDAELVASKDVNAHLFVFERAWYEYATADENEEDVMEEKYMKALEDLRIAFRKDLRIRDQ